MICNKWTWPWSFIYGHLSISPTTPSHPHLHSLLYPATISPLYLGIYKVSSRGIRVKMYALFELRFQCLSNLVQQTCPGVACNYIPTFETFIHKENCGPWAMIGICNKHWTLLKMRRQIFIPRKLEKAQLQTWPKYWIYKQMASIKHFYSLEMNVTRILAMLCCFWENCFLPEMDVSVYRAWTWAGHS